MGELERTVDQVLSPYRHPQDLPAVVEELPSGLIRLPIVIAEAFTLRGAEKWALASRLGSATTILAIRRDPSIIETEIPHIRIAA